VAVVGGWWLVVCACLKNVDRFGRLNLIIIVKVWILFSGCF